MPWIGKCWTGWGVTAVVLLLGGCAAPSLEQEAIDRGRDFLAAIQRKDGAICDTVNPLFDTWETVEAATALWECKRDTAEPVLQAALRFLKAQENADGLLCHNVKCRASYCLETSSEYCILLAEIHGSEFIRHRMEVIQKLQKPSGEWEIGNPDVLENKAFPSVTAFVLGALQAAEMSPLYPDSAWAWLLAQQNPEGNWGMAWEYYGCTAYAWWPAMRALKGDDRKSSHLVWENALFRMAANQQEHAFWDETVKNGDKKPSKVLQTALVLGALNPFYGAEAHQAARGGRDFLVQQQAPDGHWNGGHFPIANARYNKEEYVFATARAMIALNQLKNIESR